MEAIKRLDREKKSRKEKEKKKKNSKKNEALVLIDVRESKLKAQFFDGLFAQKITKYQNPVNRKLVDFSLQCTNESLNRFFNKLFNKFKKKHSFHDFMNECMYWSYFAIQRFKVKDSGSWEGIIAGTDKINIGKLITNIKTTVENEIVRYMNDDLKFTRGELDGEKGQHIKVKFVFTSLDSVLMGIEGEETTLMNTIGSEQGYWADNGEYFQTFFIKWFNEYKHRILIPSQIKLLEGLAICQHEKDGYTINDCEEITGVPSNRLKDYFNRIKERVYKAWQRENPLGEKTQLEMQKNEELCLWFEFIEKVYCDDAGQNMAISNWIVKNMDNDHVMNLLYDKLADADLKLVIKAYNNVGEVISSKVLYKIVEAVEEKLDYLQALDCKSVQFYKKQSEMDRWTLKAHKAYSVYLRSFKEQKCHVYNDGGLLIRIEDWKPQKQNVNNVIEILPSGIAYNVTTIDLE